MGIPSRQGLEHEVGERFVDAARGGDGFAEWGAVGQLSWGSWGAPRGCRGEAPPCHCMALGAVGFCPAVWDLSELLMAVREKWEKSSFGRDVRAFYTPSYNPPQGLFHVSMPGAVAAPAPALRLGACRGCCSAGKGAPSFALPPWPFGDFWWPCPNPTAPCHKGHRGLLVFFLAGSPAPSPQEEATLESSVSPVLVVEGNQFFAWVLMSLSP